MSSQASATRFRSQHLIPAAQAPSTRVVIDQEIDVLGETAGAVRHDGEAADEDVAGARVVQSAADADEILRLWRACVRRII